MTRTLKTLIDAHGSDHGLKVELYGGVLTVTKWSELCEPDENGSCQPRLETGQFDLGLALREYAAHDGRKDPSMTSRVTGAATYMLAAWGGVADWLDDDATPADHFCEDLDAARERGEFDPEATQPLDVR